MKKKRFRRELSSLSLSFLDAVTCGFGAIILLLVITKVFEPIRLEESDTELDGLVVKYEQELRDILGETDRVRRQHLSTENEIEIDERQMAALEAELTRIRAAFQNEQSEAEISAEIAGQMSMARQSLTEEMERLLGTRPRPEDYKIGGIPVDSEYIIFLVDTSPSMRQYEWDRVVSTLQDTLAIYPTVKGMQILNDDGNHLLESYRNLWIEDTRENREWILRELEEWKDLSDSNPRRGLLSAIDRYYDPAKKISLYVYSDDFSAGNEPGAINAVIREVDARNTRRSDGEKLVRIHAVAFPVFYDHQSYAQFMASTGADFSVLMRILCMRNGGTFVGLPSRRHI
jgi:hypothetical protein